MNLPAFIPSPDAIPNHWGWFYVLLLVTFLIHLIAMNLLLGGSLIAWVERVRGRGEKHQVKSLPTLVALTVNFGVPPLLFVQVLYGHYLYASSVLMAVFWIAVIPVLILSYYAAYVTVSKSGSKSPLALVALTSSAVGLLLIAFVFVNNMTLMIQPQRWEAWFETANGTFLNLADPMIWPRYLHFVVGAVAVGGLGRSVFMALRNVNTPGRQETIAAGLKVFAYATMAQVVVGLWFLISLEKDVMLLFMGQSMLHTVLLLVGIALGVAVIVPALKGRVWLTTGMLVVTLLVMILLRDLVRSAYLGSEFALSELAVKSEVSPLVAFLLVFVAGLVLIGYMIRRVYRSVNKEAA